MVADAPSQLAFYLLADAGRDPLAAVGEDPLANAPLKAYATRTVRHRLHQERLRYLVLSAYRVQCATCRLRQAPLLDAVHILGDREERSLPEIPNGLALCKIHHCAYDVGILGVDPAYRIHLRQDVLEEHDAPMLRHGLQEMHGGLIQVPRRAEHRPNRDYLAERFERFVAA